MKKSVLLPFERYEYLLNKAELSEKRIDDYATSEKQEKTTAAHSPLQLSHERQSVNDEISACFPIGFRNEVDMLLTSINNSDCVSYDDNGMLYLNGQPIHGMHVSDLLHRIIDFTQSQPINDECTSKQQQQCKQNDNSAEIFDGDVTSKSWIKQWQPLH